MRNADNAQKLLENYKGIFHTGQAVKIGVHTSTLSRLEQNGVVVKISRGLYRLRQGPPLKYPDLATVAARIPKAVICLVSALSFHELTTQIPHEVWIALPRGTKPPRVNYPPIRPIWISEPAYSSNIESHEVDGVILRVYSAEKTVADCFKHRNRLGMDIALEALKLYRKSKDFNMRVLLAAAEACRVEILMKPYLETLL